MRFKTMLGVAALMVLTVVAQAADAEWYTSYAEAAKVAKKTGKPILADFTGSDWCGWCKRLKAEVFSKQAFKDWAAKNVILLELDFPQQKAQTASLMKQNADLARKYGVQGYPTILFLKADGTKLGESGYLPGGAPAWTKDAAAKIKRK